MWRHWRPIRAGVGSIGAFYWPRRRRLGVGTERYFADNRRPSLRKDPVLTSILAYVGAAIAEIAGCFAFWAWLRLDKPVWWVIPGMISLALFAYLLTLVESSFAGRTYAAYGGVYIAASLAWLWLVEGARPDRWDTIGAALCLIGMAVILFGPRTA